MLFAYVYASPKRNPLVKRRFQVNCNEWYRELATLSVWRIEP